MSYLYPLISIFGTTIGRIFDKLNYKKNNINPIQQLYFVLLVMGIGALFVFFMKNESLPTLSIPILFLILVLVIISFFQNIFEAKGIYLKDVSYIELFASAEPVLKSFIAFCIFPSERNWKYILGIILAIIILWLGNKKKKEVFKFDEGVKMILLDVLFSAIVANILKFLLDYLEPQFIYMARIIGVLFFVILYKQTIKNLPKINNKTKFISFLSGCAFFIGSLSTLFSIKYLGLNLTILISFLRPVLIYFFSFTFLKEKLSLRRIIANFLVIILIILLIT